MPLFEYACQDCGHRFEELIMGTSPEAPKCPCCGSDKVERCMSAPAIRSTGAKISGSMPSAASCGSGGFS